jgi:hypothetical protein
MSEEVLRIFSGFSMGTIMGLSHGTRVPGVRSRTHWPVPRAPGRPRGEASAGVPGDGAVPHGLAKRCAASTARASEPQGPAHRHGLLDQLREDQHRDRAIDPVIAIAGPVAYHDMEGGVYATRRTHRVFEQACVGFSDTCSVMQQSGGLCIVVFVHFYNSILLPPLCLGNSPPWQK